MKKHNFYFLGIVLFTGAVILFYAHPMSFAQERKVYDSRDTVKVKGMHEKRAPKTVERPENTGGKIERHKPVKAMEPVKRKEPAVAGGKGNLKRKPVILHMPSLLSPKPGTSFNIYPRHTVLRWKPVPGAAGYMVEVEYNDGKWNSYIKESVVKGTGYKFDFVGMQAGRWRVWAVGEDGKEGPKSPWWGFKYTR